MKPHVRTLAVLAAAGSLAACQKPTEPPPAAAAAAPAAADTGVMSSASGDMAKMDMAGGAKMAKGTGTVSAVSTDSITVDHQPIAEANWPAMTMAFKAAPDIAKTVKPGDKVAFDLRLEGGNGEIIAIKKR